MSVRESDVNPNVASAEAFTFELSPIQEEWLAASYPSCVTQLCACCSSPKIGPLCPTGGPIQIFGDE
jgi:hypothetical protein